MRKTEREQLRKALDHLEKNHCEWEDAMAILYQLAGFKYRDWRHEKGSTVSLLESSARAKIGGEML